MQNNLLSVIQLASESGESVAVWRKRILRRQIPFVKLGRNVRVTRRSFDEFVADRVVPSIETPAEVERAR
jgi:hypothetical protein